MTRKTIGYTELEWTCPFCGTRNPGTAAKCTGCQAPMPADTKFEQAAEEKLITDEAKIAEAKAGPDIHCPFCGARNPAGATTCVQCMAELSEGVQREKGQAIGAHRDQPAADVACPYCGTMNPASALKCQQCGSSMAETREQPKVETAVAPRSRTTTYIIVGVVAVFVLLCGAFFFFANRTSDVIGTVSDVNWTRAVSIEALRPVERKDWQDQIPAGAQIGSCTQEVRTTQANPAPNSVEVCGTPYTVDTGTGVGEVVQDCEYEVYDDYCSYTAEEWQVIDTVRQQGNDLNPFWPEPQLAAGERAGAQDASYVITFRTDGDTYDYSTNETQFMQAEIGSQWILKINTFNDVNAIEPAN
ncbi:MAG: zinc ribbon domain-containing protein [Chloroflexi bacterium]|nr:zinc ribbon domain-containing protein [Chloroflexota bacterium]MBP7044050.1 zinc ribbon domain-containing protein [Chloroflexota bacterium]